MKTALKDKLLKYISETPGWFKKVDLFVLGDQWGYSPESTSRRLRQLEEEGRILKDTYNGAHAKNLMKYSRKGDMNYGVVKKPTIVERDGQLIAIM